MDRLPLAGRSALNRRALLAALQPNRDAFARLAAAEAERIDWAWTLRTAHAHKVAALLTARTHQCGVPLAPGLRAEMNAVRAEAVRNGEIARNTLAHIGEHYGRAGIPFFVVKGSVLAQHVYGDPSLRRFADVDIVVRRRDVERAEAVLRSLGFMVGGQEILAIKARTPAERALADRLTRRFDAQRLAAYSWYPPRGHTLAPIDLHWHLSPYRVHVSEDEIWRQTAPADVGGATYLTLNHPAMLLYVALHATTCLLNGFRLLHLCDVAWTASRFADEQDAIWHLAREWKVAPHLAVVFDMVQAAFGVALPHSNGGGARASGRAWLRSVTNEAFLVAAPEQAGRSALTRFSAELAWSIAMGCLRRNAMVVSHVSWARWRLRAARRWRRE